MELVRKILNFNKICYYLEKILKKKYTFYEQGVSSNKKIYLKKEFILSKPYIMYSEGDSSCHYIYCQVKNNKIFYVVTI